MCAREAKTSDKHDGVDTFNMFRDLGVKFFQHFVSSGKRRAWRKLEGAHKRPLVFIGHEGRGQGRVQLVVGEDNQYKEGQRQSHTGNEDPRGSQVNLSREVKGFIEPPEPVDFCLFAGLRSIAQSAGLSESALTVDKVRAMHIATPNCL